ncbi:MAG: pyridoxal-phosphate-dependent aminotransferase family protein [Longimicrobiales bacterium]
MQLIRSGRFFLPGPTEVHPEVLKSQSRSIISHRSPEMEAVMADIQTGLQGVLGTERPVVASTSSATGLMEAAVRGSGLRRVLSLVGGAFSGRFAKIVERSGLELESLEVPWGEAHDPDAVGAAVADVKPELVTMVHSETSTGVLNPVADLVRAVQDNSDALVVVDSVSGAAGTPVDFDVLGADLLLTGSQKAFAVPPGLSFAVASERYLIQARRNPTPGFYFDVPALVASAEANRALTTPPISVLFALQVQLRRIREEGTAARYRRHLDMAASCYRWVERLVEQGVAVEIAAPQGVRSPTVTALRLPPGTHSETVLAALAERGFSVAPGYGKWRGEYIRLGHMGDHAEEGFDALLAALERVFIEVLGGSPV